MKPLKRFLWNSKLYLTVVSLALTGCATTSIPTPDLAPTTVNVPVVLPYDCGAPPSSTKFRSLAVEFVISPTSAGVLMWGLTERNYRNLGINVAAIKKGAKQIKAQRDFYRNCIEASQESSATPTP